MSAGSERNQPLTPALFRAVPASVSSLARPLLAGRR